jgi:hypothetical protein
MGSGAGGGGGGLLAVAGGAEVLPEPGRFELRLRRRETGPDPVTLRGPTEGGDCDIAGSSFSAVVTTGVGAAVAERSVGTTARGGGSGSTGTGRGATGGLFAVGSG